MLSSSDRQPTSTVTNNTPLSLLPPFVPNKLSSSTSALSTYPHRPQLPTSFGTRLFSLPPELQTLILTHLAPDDLGILSRNVQGFQGVEEEPYLRHVWFHQTVPSRLDFSLFSPQRHRPDLDELVRKGTLKGIAIVANIRSRGYWGSESAVRLSRTHASLHLYTLRRSLSFLLSPTTRPDPCSLYARRILPSPSVQVAASISAWAHVLESPHVLERLRALDQARRVLRRLTGVSVGVATVLTNKSCESAVTCGLETETGDEEVAWEAEMNDDHFDTTSSCSGNERNDKGKQDWVGGERVKVGSMLWNHR